MHAVQQGRHAVAMRPYAAITVAYQLTRYGDSVDNTVEENSGVFSLT